MWAFYAAAVFQFGWIALAQVGIITFDPYPFAFLLFISSLLQLVFMFVIMVGQDVLVAPVTNAGWGTRTSRRRRVTCTPSTARTAVGRGQPRKPRPQEPAT
jgi:hypothetical protein